MGGAFELKIFVYFTKIARFLMILGGRGAGGGRGILTKFDDTLSGFGSVFNRLLTK
jgi:hypothetical protein